MSSFHSPGSAQRVRVQENTALPTASKSLAAIRQRWKVIALSVVIGGVAGVAAFLVTPPRYTSTIEFYVSSQIGDNAQAVYQGAQLSEQRVISYRVLLEGTRTSGGVVQLLGLPESPEQLASQIQASSIADSVLLQASVTAQSPTEATRLANALGTVFPPIVDEVERPNFPGARAPVAVRVVSPASVPSSPTSVTLPVAVLIGLLAGLAIGSVVAIVRSALDRSVRTKEQLEQCTSSPRLAEIPNDPTIRSAPLTVRDNPSSQVSESYRRLRTTLQFLQIGRKSKVIVVSSALPSEGKTTTSLNLALALAAAGERTLLIDADLRRPSVAATLGLQSEVGLTTLLTGRIAFREAIQRVAQDLDVLTSGQLPPNPGELLGSEQMVTILNDVRNIYNVIIVDSPPLVPVADTAALAPVTDGVIIVCKYGRTPLDGLRAATESLTTSSSTVLGCVFTMVDRGGRTGGYAYYGNYTSPSGPVGSDLESDDATIQTPRFAAQPMASRPTPAPRQK